MILVDTSIWIDHLHTAEPHLVELLEQEEVGVHPLVIQELALGSLARRATVLGLLGALRRFPVLRHDEVLTVVEQRRLWGRGLSAADAHLLGSVSITPGGRLWTRDRKLAEACVESGVPLVIEGDA